MNFLRKFILASIILCAKNTFAANFTVDAGGKTMTQYISAVGGDPDIDTIIFNSGDNGVLTIDADNATNTILSIEDNASNNGIIDFTTASRVLAVQNNIADQDQKLSEIRANTSDFTIDASNLYANQLTINTDSAIAGTAILNFNDISIGANNLSIANTVNISGDINVTGDINGSNTNLSFNGSSTQNIAYTIGAASRIGNIDITGSNIGATTINFNNDTTITNINFSNNFATTLNLGGTSKTINLSGDISNSGSIDAFITNSTNDGTLLISGSANQYINAKIGTSTSSRFNQVDINNTNNQITFAQDSYINNFNISATSNNSIISNSSIMDISTANIAEDVIFSCSGTMSINNLNISSSKVLTLQKSINISGNITGINDGNSETIIGNEGRVNFNGSSAQSVSYVILGGSALSSNRLASITNSNVNDITLNDNVYVTDVILNSNGNFNIVSGKIIDIEGNVTRSSGSGIIKANVNDVGTVKLSGSTAQTIYVNIVESSSRINNLNISNLASVTLNNNSYVTNLTYSGNNLTMMSNSILDINSGGMDLTNKNTNFKLSSANSSSNPFGQIELNSGNLTLSNSTVFFDYNGFTDSTLNFNYDGGTYNLINSTGTAPNLSNLSVSDNSYLFNHSLILNGGNIETIIVKDSSIFSEGELGKSNNRILNKALETSDIAADIMSISSQSELKEAMEYIRLPNNDALLKYNIAINNDVNNIISQRVRNITLFPKRNRQAFWGDVFLSNITQSKNRKKGYDGFTSGGTGFLAGYDYVNGGNVIGFTGFYLGSEIANDNKGDFTSIISSSGASIYNKFGSRLSRGFYNINVFNYISNEYRN